MESVDHTQCDGGITRAFEVLGKRWNGVILGTLAGGPAGFSELRRGIGGITDSVLSDRLTELSAIGLVARTITDARPPRVQYELTESGHAVVPALHALATWAGAHLTQELCESQAADAPAPATAA
ncbi:MAG: helix-turn-helix transcriptional regulator [Solirubrobacteraceae bacterium]|nr:helix-turn-helix transcriptional regulator [Solirubrobacteraceae bacterium]